MSFAAAKTNLLKYIKDYLGVLLKDSGRYRSAIQGPRDPTGNPPWIHLRNRNERLIANPDGLGVRCDFPHSSKLHALQFLRGFAPKLLHRALTDWPIQFCDAPQQSGDPVVSFLFAHRGTDRLKQLVHVIRSVFGQHGVPIEVIVADLTRPHLGSQLPDGITHLPIDDSQLTPGWRKAWAFNIAARQARGEVLVFQDGDICVPRDYAVELKRQLITGEWQAASLQRFLFYLSSSATQEALAASSWPNYGVDAVSQNWKGGTIAIRRDAFFAIGGFDEGFVDWGGEDDEFFDRCGTLRHNRFGYLPFVHLWHPPQAVRKDCANPNIDLILPRRLQMPVDARVQELRARNAGQVAAPIPVTAYKEQNA
ncbi:MAG: hypothetical protein KDA58_03680 [Planctomycetaceae bacterium]|nr:hypothetical protein [Planctomycetaceae bacterium]